MHAAGLLLYSTAALACRTMSSHFFCWRSEDVWLSRLDHLGSGLVLMIFRRRRFTMPRTLDRVSHINVVGWEIVSWIILRLAIFLEAFGKSDTLAYVLLSMRSVGIPSSSTKPLCNLSIWKDSLSHAYTYHELSEPKLHASRLISHHPEPHCVRLYALIQIPI